MKQKLFKTSKIKVLFILGLWALSLCKVYAKTIYVNGTATGSNNGTNWANAYTNFGVAVSASAYGDFIFVAKGTYQPPSGTSFTMNGGVKIYGSFAGTETALNQRVLSPANQSVLQGNGSSVILTSGLGADAVLDGFKITGGTGAYGNGGGIFNDLSAPTISNCIISGNTSMYGGGGIYNTYYSAPTLINCTISGNSAGYGGGIYNEESSSNLINCTITGNLASTSGGGISNGMSSATLTNCTIAGNKAADGGAVYCGMYSTINLYNSIVLGNNSGLYLYRSSLNYDSYDDAQYDINYSLVQGYRNIYHVNINWNNIDETGIVSSGVFVNPQAPGLSIVGNYALKRTSIAINKGNNTLYTNSGGNLTTDNDLAGNPRLFNGSPASDLIDLGAYELQVNLPVVRYVKYNATGANNGTSWTNAYTGFQAAINAASAGDVIYVAQGTYQPATNQYFTLKDGVEIYGSFQGTETSLSERVLGTGYSSILQGNGHRVIYNSGLTGATVLDGFKITNGLLSPGSSQDGGGMYNDGSSPTLSNLIISGNSGYWGGGIYNTYSSPILTNVIISGNTATIGGGMYNWHSSPALTNVVFSGNTTTNSGAGLYNYSVSEPTITNCTFSGNYAAGSGGAIFSASTSTVFVRNSIILGNSSGVTDYDGSTNTILNYCLVQDKTATFNGNINATGVTAANVFVSPQTPGLSTAGDYTLKAGAVVIDVGSNSLVPTNVAQDLTRNVRIHNSVVDMGAYEYNAAPFGKKQANDNNDAGNDPVNMAVNTKNSTRGNDMSVFPNPYHDQVNVSFTSASNGEALVEITDIQGKKVVSHHVTVVSGANSFVVDQASSLKVGIYFIRLSVNGEAQIVKLVRN